MLHSLWKISLLKFGGFPRNLLKLSYRSGGHSRSQPHWDQRHEKGYRESTFVTGSKLCMLGMVIQPLIGILIVGI